MSNNDVKNTEPKTITLEEALDLNPVGWFQYRLLIMCGFAFMSDALEVNLLTFIATCAGDDWGLSNAQQASITGVVFAGIIVGTMFWGMFADKYGRKATYFGACALIIMGGFLSGVSPNYYWLIFFRAIAGFGIGGANVPFDLLAEFLPATHRGTFLVYIEYFWTLGSMFVSGLAWATLSDYGWRFLAYMTALPVLLASVISYFYLPESPRWLLIKGRITEAEAIIRAAAEVNGVTMAPFRLKPVCEEAVIHDASYMDLFRDKQAMRTSIPLWLVWGTFGFTYYGLILFVSRLYATDDDDTGDDSSGCSFDYSSIFISSASEVFGCTLGALVIDRWGRVRTQTSFYLLAGLSVFLMGFETRTIAVMIVGIAGRIGAMAASNATWVTTPELYSTDMRTVGHASCVAISKLGAFCSPFMVVSSASNVTVGIVLCVMNVIAAAASNFLPDTTGMKMDEVDEDRSHRLSIEYHSRGNSLSSPRTSKEGRGSQGAGGFNSADVMNALRREATTTEDGAMRSLLSPLRTATSDEDEERRYLS